MCDYINNVKQHKDVKSLKVNSVELMEINKNIHISRSTGYL